MMMVMGGGRGEPGAGLDSELAALRKRNGLDGVGDEPSRSRPASAVRSKVCRPVSYPSLPVSTALACAASDVLMDAVMALPKTSKIYLTDQDGLPPGVGLGGPLAAIPVVLLDKGRVGAIQEAIMKVVMGD